MCLRNITGWKLVGLCIGVALVGIIFIQTYVQRGLQGRMRSSMDNIGDQFSPQTQQYEPYYSNSAGDSTRSESLSRRVNSPAVPGVPAIVRKVIKNASVSLKVKDCAEAQAGILKLVTSLDGLIVNSYLNNNPYAAKNGTAVFKIAPDKLDAVVQALRGLGEVESESVNAEDVTEQYVDLAARLDNWKLVKARLAKILEEKAREVKDILEIEKELARVGGEIDALEGRLKYLDRQVDLSTVTVSFHEDRPVISRALDFGAKFRDTLRTALETGVNAFNGVIIVLGFLLPLVLWGGIFWLLYRLGQKIFRKNK